MPKRVIILGSTGSIGRNALEVIAAIPGLEVVALSCHQDKESLLEQARRFQPEALCMTDAHFTVRETQNFSCYQGADDLCDMVRELQADIVLAAITGIAGLAPTLAAAESGKHIALANKEALVVAGPILMELAQKKNIHLIPVDSEHSAIFQCLQTAQANTIKKVTLTASGGPFLNRDLGSFESITADDAVVHPVWSMGKKISVDSATMMNKALEILEACHLFSLRAEQIDVLVHPQSVVHSMVEFCDHSVLAQLGQPDMKIPIQFALTYPHRKAGPTPRLDLAGSSPLSFSQVDPERFPAIQLGMDMAKIGGSVGAALNGANEAAVDLFLNGAISFPNIVQFAATVSRKHQAIQKPSMAQLLDIDRWAREEVHSIAGVPQRA